MPKYRSFPTELLENPDVIEAGSEVQSVLFLLGLSVDDEGRGMAHSGMLARKFNKEIEVIERALATLVACDLIVLYEAGRHHYFQICQWHRWQSLTKKTPSKYPTPPEPMLSQDAVGNPGQDWEISSQEKGKGREGEENRTEQEGEGEDELANGAPDNVVTFPTSRRDDTTTTSTGSQNLVSLKSASVQQTTAQEVATILHMPESDALLRIIQDYQDDPLLHLLGEADAAREYIDDPRRNRHGQRMSSAFFRRWLKREHEDAKHRQSKLPATAATGTEGSTARAAAPPGPARPVLPKSLMHLADQVEFGHKAKQPKGGAEK